MTEPSQYFKGRTVQEQMNEVIGYVDVRSAEVATDAIAADVAQVHQDMLDADADAAAAAASAAAAAGTLSNAVKKTGEVSQSIAGDIAVAGTLSGGSISAGAGGLGVGGHSALQDVTVSGNITVPTPTANGYAANKKYVDDQDALQVSITDINSYAVGLTGNQMSIAGDKGFINAVTSLKKTNINALGWTNLFNISTNHVYVFVMFAGQNILVCQLDGHNAARVLNVGSSNRPYTDCVKIAHNIATDEYEVWFNAAYGSWARGYMIAEGSGNGGGETTTYTIKNIRSNEPVVGDQYDTIVTSTKWDVVL